MSLALSKTMRKNLVELKDVLHNHREDQAYPYLVDIINDIEPEGDTGLEILLKMYDIADSIFQDDFIQAEKEVDALIGT